MKLIHDLPRAVAVDDRVRIRMSDGVTLAGRLWLPEGAERDPVPALLEFIPYRRRDGTAQRDAIHHGWFAAHGYACLRVDLRGSGDSEGLLEDEYTPREFEDALEILEWLERQRWCTGRVGMMGISWGGFNALQVAALQPRQLGAVVAASASDDRYADDVHHMGGCLLGDNLSWASVMFAFNSLPPDPRSVGARWRELWHRRLEGCRPWLTEWLRHQRRDAFWRRGSVCEDYGAIRCPVFTASGWADGYSNAVFRLLEGLSVPRRGLIGPWGHLYPHAGQPGPAIGFLQECLRWWDRWLKAVPNGVEDEPELAVWLQDSVPPTASYAHRPGRWIAEARWPSPRTRVERFALDEGRLRRQRAAEGTTARVRSPLTVGLFAGKWCSYAAGPDLAHDQRREDGGALVFETEPLEAPLVVLGAPRLHLRVAADRPQAQIAARLSDVAPDDKATRFTYGLKNLTHRRSRTRPEPLEPGRAEAVLVELNHIAQVVPAGHRLRLSLSSCYWPLAWPPPEPVGLAFDLAECTLELPCRSTGNGAPDPPAFGEPLGAAPPPARTLQAPRHEWRVVSDLATDTSALEVTDDRGVVYLEDVELRMGVHGFERYSSEGDDFTSARGETHWTWCLERDDWHVRTETRTVLTADREHFHVDADVDAFEDGRRVFCRTFSEHVPRDHV